MPLKILVNSMFRGGAEMQAALLAGALKADAFLLLDPRSGEVTGAPKPTSLSKWNLPLQLPGAIKTLLSPLYSTRLAALSAREDTVLSLMERSNFVNILAARKTGHRAVICERTQPSREFSGLRGALMKPVIRRLYPKAGLVIANSEGVALDLARNFGVAREKITVITNACDTSLIAAQAAEPLEERYKTIFERPVLIASARLSAAKGHWHLLRIFAEVKRNFPDCALVFIGSGELQAKLLGLCAGLGLSAYFHARAQAPTGREDVFFLGFQKNPHKFSSKASLLAFTSLWEGFPNAITEALACGLPVVSGDCRSGPREILAPETDFKREAVTPEETAFGLLMPPFDAHDRSFSTAASAAEKLWAQQISSLLGDKARLARYGAAGRARAEDFSLQLKLEQWKTALSQPTR